MHCYEWKPSYDIGYPQIDRQHRQFLDLINDLIALQLRDQEVIERILVELQAYTQYHFISEENLMLLSEYGDLNTHRGEHDALLQLLDDNIEKYKGGTVDLHDLVLFLVKWFVTHVSNEDRQLGAHLLDSHFNKHAVPG
ncbi:MAG: bacteriohemerythrin [Planctomycetota bacterium]|jgi:hemerythrin|nr:bacteriohemerythrin [Planctomycetota bacterium]